MNICSIQILKRRMPYSEQTRAGRLAVSVLTVVVAVGLTFAAGQSANRVAAIHQQVVFADMHAHPSHFHRANVSRIEPDELARYRRGLIDVVVCSISTDAQFSGGYVKRDGTEVKRGKLSGPDRGAVCIHLTDSPASPGRSTTATPCSRPAQRRCSTRNDKAG